MTVEEVAAHQADGPEAAQGAATVRAVVAWQHPDSRRIAPVGFLERTPSGGYRFRYLRRVAETDGFRPFVGFPELERAYESSRLFPIFAQRVMSARRPDYLRYLQMLHLHGDASPWEQMIRSEGRRTGDTVQVFPVPTVETDGRTTCRFLVHGVRYFHDGLPRLRVGERLTLREERSNPVNPAALLVCNAAGEAVGYVPDLLLEHVHVVRATGPFDLVAEQVNGLEAPPHLRLLVRLDGRVPEGYRPMRGPGWETFT